MRVLFINNNGGGFSDYIELPEGMTVQELFKQKVPHGSSADYLIRVNRQSVAARQVLLEGDRISITPTKIEGAHHFVNAMNGVMMLHQFSRFLPRLPVDRNLNLSLLASEFVMLQS